MLSGSMGFQENQDQNFFAKKRADLVELIRRSGKVSNEEVLTAIGNVPREKFVSREMAHHSYGDHPLPISSHQTISQVRGFLCVEAMNSDSSDFKIAIIGGHDD